MRDGQTTIDQLGSPLHETTFVVVDLETTGGSPADHRITEIGAVKVRGGTRQGEFSTLVDPGVPIPAFITALTGITDAMVAGAPTIAQVLPSFLEFARGCVLVAHNAPFDLGFLTAACRTEGYPWPDPPVIDTAKLARHLVSRDEARNRKLSTLAQLFGATRSPDHRALHDAEATVDILHALIERAGGFGVTSVEELASFTSRVSPAVRRQRHLADSLPHAPGVYLFRDASGHPLYVGVSQDIRNRVRGYFTASETRSRMRDMVLAAHEVTAVVCVTPLEARVRELRMIADLNPPYNRRSRRPERSPWVKLTEEAVPRLSVVRTVRPDGGTYIGPFPSTATARLAIEALWGSFRVRQCTTTLPRRPRTGTTSCLNADLDRCDAPCVAGRSPTEYATTVDRLRETMTVDCRRIVDDGLGRARELSEQQRFEEAAVVRDRLLAFLDGAARTQRLLPLARSPELIAGARTPDGGWELVLIRHGRLASTTITSPGADPWPAIRALQDSGEHVEPPVLPQPAAHPEETELILRWLDRPGTRLISWNGQWATPRFGAVGQRHRLTPLPSPEEEPRIPTEPTDWARRALAALRQEAVPNGSPERLLPTHGSG
jgi:DNA polymerase-3 subunit epsilon